MEALRLTEGIMIFVLAGAVVLGTLLAWCGRHVRVVIVCEGCGKAKGLRLVLCPKRVGKK
ncbi:hypothetical protein GCM10010277_79340 [Streptomyces longisporoflavus]|nr:hypothetical protein GCM10010277_79340 [Streptomyces longisporoflavus]